MAPARRGARPQSQAELWPDSAVQHFLDVYNGKCLELRERRLREKDWHDVQLELHKREGTPFPKGLKQLKHKLDGLIKRYKSEKERQTIVGVASSWRWFAAMEVMLRSNPKMASGAVDGDNRNSALQLEEDDMAGNDVEDMVPETGGVETRTPPPRDTACFHDLVGDGLPDTPPIESTKFPEQVPCSPNPDQMQAQRIGVAVKTISKQGKRKSSIDSPAVRDLAKAIREFTDVYARHERARYEARREEVRERERNEQARLIMLANMEASKNIFRLEVAKIFAAMVKQPPPDPRHE